jgi:hypothetical protein
VQIQASVRAGQANINYCTKFQQYIFNLASVTGWTNSKTPPAAIPERYMQNSGGQFLKR